MRHVLTLPGDWTSPWIMLRLLQVVESPWEATERGFVNEASGERALLAMGAPIEGLAKVFAEGTDPTHLPFEDALIENLEAHHAVVQVSTEEGKGDPLRTLRAVVNAANAVVDAGALAVQVGSSGLAHSADAFQALVVAVDAAGEEDEALRRALFPVVVRFKLGREAMTLGMHALGRPDAVLLDSGSPDRAVGLLERAVLAPELPVAEADTRTLPEPWRNPFGILHIQ